ncbi:UDP-N-acetylmuramoyl-tripeptide--D-alanyl-D-alanine ligase [Halobacillus rhizosphaerae]|uniref:UDP-N-acetylmuramoyl-tripeptide--D-alanyl-D- alanine ligase n=1 Tax=Halobacillus rhizosphaerae TaxID=3064889 RepID=UPI00398B1EB4
MKLEAVELVDLFTNYKGAANDRIALHQVMTDTRKEAKQSLFVPIVGDAFDAHDFLKQAIQQGAVAALWQENRALPKFVPTDFPVFYVKDTTEALQQLAEYYLRKINPLVIGVTGSNGKTTTKDMAASVLSTIYNTHKTAGNFNNHIGLPLTVLSMPEGTEALVLEMGMNNAGEISLLSRLATPDYAIITNIGESHLENLGSREAIASAKAEILEGLKPNGKVIIDGDEALLAQLKKEERSISCGFKQLCNYTISVEAAEDNRSVFSVNGIRYELPMAGSHNVKNAAFVIALCEQLQMPTKSIQQGLNHLTMSGMRFEKHEGIKGSLIINDAYNASPTSMKAVIEVVHQLQAKKHKVLVLGDMFELGEKSLALHAGVGEAIPAGIHAVYTLGNQAKEISTAAAAKNPQMEVYHFTDKKELISQLLNTITEDTVVLLKASRKMKLEELLLDLTD